MHLLTITAVADRLAISRSMVYELMRDGSLSSVKIGRSRRIPAESVEQYIRQAEQPTWIPV